MFGVATRCDGCDGCIAAHVQAAIKAGAVKAELVETAVLMGGGPSFVYGTQALAAVEELMEA